MKINVVRLQDNYLNHELLDAALLVHIEFVLDDERSIYATIENGILYISSSIDRLKIAPRSSNAISIEVTK